MLEGVSREAGPFEFVVCADGARVGRRVRAWAGGYARGPDCARVGPNCARGPGTARVGQWLGAWAGGPFYW